MTESLKFETPENIQVSYRPAGLGTRFVAWFLDSLLLWLLAIGIFFLLLVAAAAWTEVLGTFVDRLDIERPEDLAEILPYFIGIATLAIGFSSFAYFSTFELLLRGQTPGKRKMGVRVVQRDGFSLSPTSILIRNIFRVIDQLPVLWVVPVVSARGQRFGDMAAGTVVVSDDPQPLGDLRRTLLARLPADAQFRFDGSSLAKLKGTDAEAIEKILERWESLPAAQRDALGEKLATNLASRLGVEAPEPAKRLVFLEDLLASIYRREYRRLG